MWPTVTAIPLFVSDGFAALAQNPELHAHSEVYTVLEHVVPLVHEVPGLGRITEPEEFISGIKRAFIAPVCAVPRFQERQLHQTWTPDAEFPFRRYIHPNVSKREGQPILAFSSTSGDPIPMENFSWESWLSVLDGHDLYRPGLEFYLERFDADYAPGIRAMLVGAGDLSLLFSRRKRRNGMAGNQSGRFTETELGELYRAVTQAIVGHDLPAKTPTGPVLYLRPSHGKGRVAVVLRSPEGRRLFVLNIGPDKGRFEFYHNQTKYDLAGISAMTRAMEISLQDVNLVPRKRDKESRSGWSRASSAGVNVTSTIGEALTCVAAMASVYKELLNLGRT